MYRLSKRSISNMVGVDSRLIEVAELAIEITKVDFGIPSDGGLRTDEEQFEIFKRGNSNCDGYKNKSNHQADEGEEGKALDFFPFVNGSVDYGAGNCDHVAAAFLEAANRLGIKISWSGFWTGFQEKCHIQLEE